MDSRRFHWITLATAVVAALGAALSLALSAAAPAAEAMAGCAGCPLIALPATAPQTRLKS